MTQVGGPDAEVVEVVPGETATCGLTVRNTSAIVEEYTFHVGDEVSGWTEVEPARTNVYPGTEQRITLTFRPPRTNGPAAGDITYRIFVTPVEQPDTQVVMESMLRVAPFTDLTAEIVPRTSTSAVWGGRHDVAVDNRGNTPVELRVTGTDPDRRLVIEPRPAVFTVGPGEAAFVKVRARPARLQMSGRPVARPYQITVAQETATPLALDATMVQRPLIPAGTVRVLAGLIALTMLGTALWYGVVRRAATTAAREVVREEVVPIADRANNAENAAENAAKSAQGAANKAGRVTATPTPTPTATAGPGGIPPGATLFNQRLETTSAVGGTVRDQYRVPQDATLIMTFVDLQNPWAARGLLELSIGGRTVFTEEQAYYRNEIRYFPTPIQVPGGQVVGMQTTCAVAGSPPPGGGGAQRCRAYVLIGGYLLPKRAARRG